MCGLAIFSSDSFFVWLRFFSLNFTHSLLQLAKFFIAPKRTMYFMARNAINMLTVTEQQIQMTLMNSDRAHFSLLFQLGFSPSLHIFPHIFQHFLVIRYSRLEFFRLLYTLQAAVFFYFPRSLSLSLPLSVCIDKVLVSILCIRMQ